jgi:hypothetical protein
MTQAFEFRETTVVRKARAMPFIALGTDFLAFDADTGFCLALNGVGLRVWDLLDSPATVDSICDRLGLEYDVDESTCRRDVLELLGQLAEAGLVGLDDE